MEEEKKKISQRLREEGALLKEEFKQRVVANIITAFGVVAALAWNDAIQEGIKYLFPINNSSVQAKFLYAILITLIIVLFTVYVTRWFTKK